MNLRALLIASCLISFSSTSFAAPICGETKKDVSLRSELASAGTLANLRSTEESLKVRSLELLKAAFAALPSQLPPDGLCPAGCSPVRTPQVVFTSVPNKFLEKYSDKATCLNLAKTTTATPILFDDRHFDSVAELSAYQGDIGQGYGVDGKKLYTECPGSCSPRYETVILAKDGKYQSDISVICGEARDQSDGMYRIAAAYRWSCEEPKSEDVPLESVPTATTPAPKATKLKK